jgi:CRISPR-associated protein Cas5d
MHDWCLEIWGDFACFTRPEFKVERVSYDVPTPSAARAIFESILWKPQIRWEITKIEVLNPIKWISLRRNEVSKTINPPSQQALTGILSVPEGIYIEDYRQQRGGLILRDVKYRIHGFFTILKEDADRTVLSLPQKGSDKNISESVNPVYDEGKYSSMFERRAKNGQCFTRPYLGTREFSCFFRLVNENLEPSNPINETRDLGFMLYDLDFKTDPKNPSPIFFRALMNRGIILTDKKEVELIK